MVHHGQVGEATNVMVYRPVLVRVAAVVVWLAALWWAGTLAVQGRWQDVAFAVPVQVAVCLVVYLLFWRPAVVVDDDAVVLRNVLRDDRVPWRSLKSVDTRYALTLVTADDRRMQSWAAAAPGRSLAFRDLAGRRGAGSATGAAKHDPRLPDPRWSVGGHTPQQASRDLRGDAGAAAFMVEQRWHAWRDRQVTSTVGAAAGTDQAPAEGSHPGLGSGDSVTVRWNVVPLVALVAAVLASVAVRIFR